MKHFNHFPLLLSLICVACNSGGTATGNPAVNIASHGYNATLASTITSLKFCVVDVQFLSLDGSRIQAPRASLGFVDLGDGSTLVNWGATTLGKGTTVSRVNIEVQQDAQICPGSDYSMQANGSSLTQDLEFKFAFDLPVTIGTNETITFSLTNLASKISQALQDGKFDDADIGNYINSEVEDEADGDSDDL